jgi:hypothetical protein
LGSIPRLEVIGNRRKRSHGTRKIGFGWPHKYIKHKRFEPDGREGIFLSRRARRAGQAEEKEGRSRTRFRRLEVRAKFKDADIRLSLKSKILGHARSRMLFLSKATNLFLRQ